jgi:ATP-dependent exoDNAse (exonuclease V) beta subunit
MQWQNLVPLIDNALSSEDLSGDRGSLMIVGDPKQSIYRWRGGKAEQFIELSKEHNPFSNKDKKLLNLGKNYRSYSNVIHFNNEFFSFLSEKFSNEDYRELYGTHSRQEFNAKGGGYVNISFIREVPFTEETEAANKDEMYLEAVLETIKKVRDKGFRYKDIVLLTRRRQPGVLLANYLTENQIPILSSETLLIENSTEVKLIINLLRYLKSNENVEAKAYFLYFAAKNLTMENKIHDFILEGLSMRDEESLESWLGANGISISFRACRKKSLYEAVETIIGAFIKDRSNQSYVQYFLDLVLERDVKVQSGIADFLDYWDNNGSKFSIPSPEGNDAVRIMTIHKSKGLEFPVVIFPFAEEDYARVPRSKMWLDLDDETFEFQKALIDSKKEVAEYGEKASQLYTIKSQEELLDNINILYVALTRAEEQLYIISGRNFTSKGELTNNMSSYFIEYLQELKRFDNTVDEYEFGNPEKLSATEEESEPQQTIMVVKENFNPRAVKIAQRESLMWGTARLKAIEFGNVMHEILSFVTTKNDIPVALMKAVENGLITTSQQPDVEQSLRDIIFHPELEEFFTENTVVFREQNIIRKNVQTIKPDRVTIKEGKALLLDYKTGAHQAKYERQLAEYQLALEEMGYTVAKKSLVYIGEGVNVVNLPL